MNGRRSSSTSNRSKGITLNFRQTVELYLWVLGETPKATRTPNNNNTNAESDVELSPVPMKESKGDSSFPTRKRPSNQEPLISTDKLFSKTAMTMARLQYRESPDKGNTSIREKFYNWTAGVIRKHDQPPDSKTINTITGVEEASECSVPVSVLSCSSTCNTKTDGKGPSKKTSKASWETTRHYIKSYLESSEGSALKRASSESTTYYIKSSDMGIQKEIPPNRSLSECSTNLYKSGNEGNLKRMVPKRVPSYSAVHYVQSASRETPVGFVPRKVLLESNCYCFDPAAKAVQESINSNQTHASMVPKKALLESIMHYISPADAGIPEGIVPKKVLSMTAICDNKPAIMGAQEGIAPKMASSESAICFAKPAAEELLECILPKRTSSYSTICNNASPVEETQRESNETTSDKHSPAAVAASTAAVAASTASAAENICSQSQKSRKHTKSHSRKNSQKKKSVMECFSCFPRRASKHNKPRLLNTTIKTDNRRDVGIEI